ncbi:type II toxin-antitoxin system VapC family toxin [Sphingobium sp. AR-3-1]|uniref:Type II toxin-antitoxin system VapC family toxin n=1 Tax=Sphingobium psychrophilum TaxID=2728834 RepID=A0A7X9WVQ4_9SPHN|nr:type II toxin-antitoxin system VapC family toxin [Sphingobium psychrophilum]NML10782.1 type II toxin-antitoxin system VapC family toxin [Sphingobium psychrophilum]
MILVDSNVLIDVLDRDPHWFEWSAANIDRAALGAHLFVNPIVIGEMAPRFEALDDLRVLLAAMLIDVEPLMPEGAFLAGRAFEVHRARKQPGVAKAILADFLIGGHAQSAGASILTRDPRFYRSYFPGVPLITPSKDD